MSKMSMERALEISKKLREKDGELEEMLCAKCNWEHMTRTAVLREWGHPKNWVNGNK